MVALIRLSPLFFVSLLAFADDAEHVEIQAIVIQEQVEQAEKMEQELAEILRLIEEKKAAEEAARLAAEEAAATLPVPSE